MKSVFRVAAVVAVCGLSAVMGGCWAVAAGAAGAGTYAYVTGNLEANAQAGLDRTYDSAVRAVNKFGWTIKEQAKDAFQARIVAAQADGSDVSIKMERKADNLTEVRIRIGVFGDEDKSVAVMDEINRGL